MVSTKTSPDVGMVPPIKYVAACKTGRKGIGTRRGIA